MLPWRFTGATEGLFSDENIYAIIILGLTSLYAIKGGMISVVITEVMQFTHPHRSPRITIGVIAICKVSPAMIAEHRPRRLGQPVLRLETRPRLDRHPRQGQRRHPAGRQRVLLHHLRPDVLQGRAGQPGRARARTTTCSACWPRAIRARPA